MVRRSETIAVDMTIEQALRFTISAGVITPDQEGVKRAEAVADNRQMEPIASPKATEST
jgi:uncharacterized membrane protein